MDNPICDAKKFLRLDSLAAKKFLLLNYSKRKEVLAVRRTQAQASAICRKKLPGLRTQKEVLARALFLGCTVCYIKFELHVFVSVTVFHTSLRVLQKL